MNSGGPIIIDVEPNELRIDGKKKDDETDDMVVFMRHTFTYGMKTALNFFGWCIKETFRLIVSSLRMAAEGNREMHEELKKGRPKYAKKRPAFYIPTREEEMEDSLEIYSRGRR